MPERILERVENMIKFLEQDLAAVQEAIEALLRLKKKLNERDDSDKAAGE